MKHVTFEISAVLFFLSLSLGGLLAEPSLAQADQGKKIAEILLLKGQVFVLDPRGKVSADPEGKSGRSKVEKGLALNQGETVQTKADGRVKIKFLEGANEVTLGADTALVIERAGSGGSTKGTSLNLLRGDVRSDVKVKYSGKGDDKFEVKTKNAVAGVRGTIFTTSFRKETTQVATLKGSVNVQSGSGNGVLVKAGMFTAAGTAGVLPPAPISSNRELSAVVSNLSGDGGGASADASSSDAAPDSARDPAGSKDSTAPQKDAAPSAEPSTTSGDGEKKSSAPLGREKVESKNATGEGGERGPASEGRPVLMGGDKMRNSPVVGGNNPLGRVQGIMDGARQAQQNQINNNLNQNVGGQVKVIIGR